MNEICPTPALLFMAYDRGTVVVMPDVPQPSHQWVTALPASLQDAQMVSI